jgi:transposase InsO family protein
VGYKVSDNMRAKANMDALHMALKENEAPLIHHSDRGSQYTLQRIYRAFEAKWKSDQYGSLSSG